ncbi:hypothetical protein AGMMS50229_18230 [Campylobacterota bacterium]|nr:hypothetical protein AGMMS50229_18230 [Campylobacterota bacterium]
MFSSGYNALGRLGNGSIDEQELYCEQAVNDIWFEDITIAFNYLTNIKSVTAVDDGAIALDSNGDL